MDTGDLAAALAAAVPFNATLGVLYDELTPTRAIVRMPDDVRLHNHVGGPHAGAMFSLGESASGGVVIACFAAHLEHVTPLAAGAEIRYRKVAHGEVTATATMTTDPATLLESLDRDGKVAFEVAVTIVDASGETTGEMAVRWHLRRNR